MPRTKIQDEGEVLRWFAEGRTYQWMTDRYLEKYNIETGLSLWGNFRRRHDLPRRIAWDDRLIPWVVKVEHRYSYPIKMLHREARRRAGFPLKENEAHEVDVWIENNLTSRDAVLHYDPDTEQGWFYVPRREGIDHDLIREPDSPVRGRRKGD